MAPGRRRLGPFLNPTDASLVELLTLLDATPAPHGAEVAQASALAGWCQARWPFLTWTIHRYGASGANLHVTDPRCDAPIGEQVLLYSHLDTSLTGDPARDLPITGRSEPTGPLTVDGRTVEGFGLGVARAPAAAALLAFVAAATVTSSLSASLLLAGGGTHRARRSTGIDHFLDQVGVPGAAVIAKCGPPTVLWEEPGALYLRLRIRGGHGAVLAPASANPVGGIIAHAGVVLDAVERWRDGYLSSRAGRGGQTGPAAGIGALSAGSPDKPDLFPALLDLWLYVVTIPGEDPQSLGTELAGVVRAAFPNTPLAGCEVEVTVDEVHPAGRTPADAPVVAAARAAWQAEFGTEPPEITNWTGSTDGVVLRGRGVPTVRLGPQASPSPADRRRDQLPLPHLATYARLYQRIVLKIM